LFTFLRVRGLFLRSEAPGLVFSATYLWGSSAPSAFSACGGVNNLMLRVVNLNFPLLAARNEFKLEVKILCKAKVRC